ANGVVRRLLAQICVVRQVPLCPGAGWWRADGHGRSWSPPRPPSRSGPPHRRERAGCCGSCPKSRRRALPPDLGHGVSLRGGLQRGGVAGLLGDRRQVATPRMAPPGVVAGQPLEELATAGELVGPGPLVLEDLPLQRGVE